MAVASRRGHEVQDLLVGPALHGDAVDAHELVGGAQPAVLLRGAQRDDGPDVDLARQRGGGLAVQSARTGHDPQPPGEGSRPSARPSTMQSHRRLRLYLGGGTADSGPLSNGTTGPLLDPRVGHKEGRTHRVGNNVKRVPPSPPSQQQNQVIALKKPRSVGSVAVRKIPRTVTAAG